MADKTILICDNERDLVDVLSYNLEREGYRTLTAFDGVEAVEQAQRHTPDLVLLDVMMPRKAGTEVAAALRNDPRTRQTPIIMLTAKTSETDAVVGYTVGADYYVRKPFGMKELIALVEAAMRRASGNIEPPVPEEPEGPADMLVAGPIALDKAKHQVTVDGEVMQLTLTEWRLLLALLSARGRVLSRNQLMDQALGVDVFVTDRTIDVHVTALRKKLGDYREMIETVRGVGYRLREAAR